RQAPGKRSLQNRRYPMAGRWGWAYRRKRLVIRRAAVARSNPPLLPAEGVSPTARPAASSQEPHGRDLHYGPPAVSRALQCLSSILDFPSTSVNRLIDV